jgi:hypothetical protein
MCGLHNPRKPPKEEEDGTPNQEYYWKLKSCVSRTYVKYIFHVVKNIPGSGYRLLLLWEVFLDYANHTFKFDNPRLQPFVCLASVLLYVPSILVILGVGYVVLVLWFYATLLPFYILAFPLKYFVFGFNLYSFSIVSQTLASLYVCFFPEIKKCVPFAEEIELEDILPNILKSFEIKPKTIMSVVPLLVQKRKDCVVECVDTLLLSYFIFGAGFVMSILFLAGGFYF